MEAKAHKHEKYRTRGEAYLDLLEVSVREVGQTGDGGSRAAALVVVATQVGHWALDGDCCCCCCLGGSASVCESRRLRASLSRQLHVSYATCWQLLVTQVRMRRQKEPNVWLTTHSASRVSVEEERRRVSDRSRIRWWKRCPDDGIPNEAGVSVEGARDNLMPVM